MNLTVWLTLAMSSAGELALASGPMAPGGQFAIDPALPVASLALLSAASAAGLLCLGFAAARRQLAGFKWVGAGASRLPAWIRALQPVLALLAAPLGPRLPAALRERVFLTLRAAEVEEELQPQQFLALGGLHLLCGIAVASILWTFGVLAIVAGLAVALLPWAWVRDARRRREWEILRDLSVYVDMLTLALEAGGALSVALRVATERMPDSALRRAFHRVQNDLRAGRSRADALRALAQRVDAPSVSSLVAALVQAETSGGSLSGVLRAQSEQRLNERFARAERLALEAPVKLLAPLILCIFPCTFLVLAFPVVVRLLEG
jgi:tight adherence protein C